MKLIMTLVVRDEEDILETQLRYHHARGVDFFLVLDHASVDRTPEILKTYENKGWLQWFSLQHPRQNQGKWVTTLARRAYAEHQADWVINNDADEFWWCKNGEDLKTTLQRVPPAQRLVYAPRTNFWAPEELGCWHEQIYRQEKALNFLGEPLSGKICHRAEPHIYVHHGNHSVAPMKAEDIWTEQPLEIFHFPVRSWEQFKNKVRNGGRSWVSNTSLAPHIGKAKKHLYTTYLTEQLYPVYQQWKASAQTDNRIQDSRFFDFLQKLS